MFVDPWEQAQRRINLTIGAVLVLSFAYSSCHPFRCCGDHRPIRSWLHKGGNCSRASGQPAIRSPGAMA